METTRSGDLVIPQELYVLLQDGMTGQVDVITGPYKQSLGDTDQPVIYNHETRRYEPVKQKEDAFMVCPIADEGQYILLTNPSVESNGTVHPSRGKNTAIELELGRKINIQGPNTFALFPGQLADVIDGHQLKSNEYLVIRVYNEEAARANLKDAVIKAADDKNSAKNLIEQKDLSTGNLLIIKGTDVSFYIPPTGIEVLTERNDYVRKAVTLERLEYCILLNENGDKRFVKGPSVVFPEPTETFVETNGKKIFKAIELNENMGLYIKVIADYDKYKAGEELFITGKEQKIYYPRAEHAIIKYGDEMIHYATAVPAGEGRYGLNKVSGEVNLVKGPLMLLPDPRKEVIVKRVLDDKTVSLWYPGNAEALEYNRKLRGELETSGNEYLADTRSASKRKTKSSLLSGDALYSAAMDMAMDEMERKTNYTRPRSIKLDTKYEGAVTMNIWPNYAVQVVNKKGERKVVEGPAMIMLEYDETLDVLELSTGTPKTDEHLMRTVYLQTKNNVVSDIVRVETKDLIEVDVHLSYRVNFDDDKTKWFNVADYVKLLTHHMRSIVRNAVKKVSIETFNVQAVDLIRNIILGESKAGKRAGRTFVENNMCIYDVEVLNLVIEDPAISKMLVDNQHSTIHQNLLLAKETKSVAHEKQMENFKREKIGEKMLTDEAETKFKKQQLNAKKGLEKDELEANLDQQKILDSISEAERSRKDLDDKQELEITQGHTELKIQSIEREMKAIQPKLVEAIISYNDVKLSDTLARNLKEQGGAGFLEMLSGKKGGFQALLDTVKGSPLENRVKRIIKDYQDLYKDS